MEGKKLSNLNVKKKKILNLSILAVMLFVFILSTNHVRSSGKLELVIEYQEDEWDLTEGSSFESEWLTSDEAVEFIVDLSDHYSEAVDIDSPFDIEAKYQGNSISSRSITPIESTVDEETVFGGQYRVAYALPETDGKLELKLNFLEENGWGIPTDKNPISFTIIKDSSAPEISISGVEDGMIYYQSKLDFKIEISDPLLDPDQTIVKLNPDADPINLDWIEKNGVYSAEHQIEADDTYQLEVSAYDRAGNETTQKLTFAINNNGPELQLFSAEQTFESGAYLANGDIEFHFENTVPIKSVDLVVEKDGDEMMGNSLINIDGNKATVSSEFAEGSYQVTAIVEDEGSEEKHTHTIEDIQFVIDQTAPVIEVPELEEYYTQELDVDVKVTEKHYDSNEVTVTIEKQNVDGVYEDHSEEFNEWKNKGEESTNRYRFNTDGRYRIRVSAEDQAGNTSTIVERIFTVSRYAPELKVEGVTDGGHYNEAIETKLSIASFFLDRSNSRITVEKWDQETEEFVIYPTENEIDHSIFGMSLTETLSEAGQYRLSLAAQDYAGNTSEPKQVEFIIDQVAPLLTFDGVENGSIYGDQQTISFTVIEQYYQKNNVNLTVERNGHDISQQVHRKLGDEWMKQGEESIASYQIERDGAYTFRLEATDAAGNQAEAIETSFTVDSSYPAISVDGVENEEHYAEDRAMIVEIHDRNFDTNEITVTKDDEPYDVGEFDVTNIIFQDSIAVLSYTFVEEGTYQVEIESIDRSSNRSHKEIHFTIDKTVPVLELGKQMPSFITSEVIETQGINHLIPLEIQDLHINDKTVKVIWTSPIGEETQLDQSDVGAWEQLNDGHHRFEFNKEFYQSDGDYQLTVYVSDLAGQDVQDALSFTVDNTRPQVHLSDISQYNNAPVTQEIEVIEHNYESNDVTIDVYQENNQGQFVPYDHSKAKNWNNSAQTSQLSLDFDQDGKYRIVVNAVDAAGNQAQTASQIFTIDQMDPSLSIRGVNDQEHYNQSRQVTVEVKDTNLNPDRTNLMIYKLNEQTGKMEQYDSVPKVSFSARRANWSHLFSTNDEGIFQIRLNATDWAGNSSSHETITFTIDKTAPVLQANQIEDGQYYGSNQTVEFIVQERHFTENNVDFSVTRNGQNITSNIEGSAGSTWRNAASRSHLNYHFNQDGAYTVLMNAVDNAGNVATTVNKQFVIDTVNPVIEIDGIENDQHYNMDRPVSVTVRDVNLDQQTIRVTRDGANYSVGTFSIANQRYQESIASLAHTFSAEGDYVIYVEATDQAGHSDQLELSFTIDKTAPEITPIMGPNGSIIEDGSFINQIFTPVFKLDQPDEDTIDSVTLNNGPNIAGRIPVAGQEMTYQYTVVASDRAGNTTELNVSFVLDTTIPTLSITGIIDGFFNEAITPIIEYADDHLDQERTFITLNGVPFTSGTTIQEERDYILKASIADLAHNITEQSIVFTIDKTAPTIRFNEPMSNQYFNDVLIPEFFIEDMTDYEIIAMTLNGQPYELGQQIETEGKHVLYFEVRDRAGNIQQLTVEFIIDMTAPELIVEGVEQNQRYYESVDLSIRLLDQEDMIQTITVNGEDHYGKILDEENGQQIHLSFIEPGNYHVKVAAYDLAGNQSHQDIQFEIAEKTVLMKWYENRPLFTGSIIGLLAITGTSGTIFYRKRQRNLSE